MLISFIGPLHSKSSSVVQPLPCIRGGPAEEVVSVDGASTLSVPCSSTETTSGVWCFLGTLGAGEGRVGPQPPVSRHTPAPSVLSWRSTPAALLCFCIGSFISAFQFSEPGGFCADLWLGLVFHEVTQWSFMTLYWSLGDHYMAVFVRVVTP